MMLCSAQTPKVSSTTLCCGLSHLSHDAAAVEEEEPVVLVGPEPEGQRAAQGAVPGWQSLKYSTG